MCRIVGDGPELAVPFSRARKREIVFPRLGRLNFLLVILPSETFLGDGRQASIQSEGDGMLGLSPTLVFDPARFPEEPVSVFDPARLSGGTGERSPLLLEGEFWTGVTGVEARAAAFLYSATFALYAAWPAFRKANLCSRVGFMTRP